MNAAKHTNRLERDHAGHAVEGASLLWRTVAGSRCSDAIKLLCDLLEAHDPGILADPDATQGKKQKPKFKERARHVAKRLLAARAERLEASGR